MKRIPPFHSNLFNNFFVRIITKQETVSVHPLINIRCYWSYRLHWSRDSQPLVHLSSWIIITFLPRRLFASTLRRTSFFCSFGRFSLLLFLQTPTNHHHPAGLLFPPSLSRGFSPNSRHYRPFSRHSAFPPSLFQSMAASFHLFSRHPAGSAHFPPTRTFPRGRRHRLSTHHRSRHLLFSFRFRWRELSLFPPSPIIPPFPRFFQTPRVFHFPPSSNIPAVVPSPRGFSRQLSPDRRRCRRNSHVSKRSIPRLFIDFCIPAVVYRIDGKWIFRREFPRFLRNVEGTCLRCFPVSPRGLSVW